MEFIKKNYEKVLLAVVLLGLTLAACLLPFIISAKRAKLESYIQREPHPKDLPPVDMAMENTALQRAQAPYMLDLTNKHNLFNPVIWKKRPDGTIVKQQAGNEEGASALELTNTHPLYLEVKFSGQSGTGYTFTIERQGELNAGKRHTSSYVSKENKSDLLTLKEVKGPPEKPTELDLEWNATGDAIVVTPDKPFRRVDAYSADIKYPPENRTWTDRRVQQALAFANGSYKIVAITQSNVVVLDESNKKKTTITLHSPN